MKTKTLLEAGSGCFALPLLSLAASASELPIVSIPQTSTEPLSYPSVGFLKGEPVLTTSVEPTNLAATAVPIETEAIDALEKISRRETQTLKAEENLVLGTMLVHLSVENTIGVPILVKGAEDGYRAQVLEDWLIPFDDVVKALGLTATLQADGQIELRSPEVVTQVRLEDLAVDPELGSVWSVSEIEHLFSTSVEFDRAQYRLQFNSPEPSLRVSAQTDSDQYRLIDATFAGGYSVEPVADEAVQSTEQSEADRVETLSRLSASESEGSQLSGADLEDAGLGVMLVGLAVDSITTVEASLVKGKEDGIGAIAFDQWRIPFDDAMTALGGDVTPQADGTLAIRIPGVATSIDPATLRIDADLGMTLSIAEIEAHFGIPAEFDFSQYAVKFRPPLQRNQQQAYPEMSFGENNTKPIVTAGLPAVEPSGFSFSGIHQTTRISNSGEQLIGSTNGQLAAMGSAFGGSWYSRIEQPEINNYNTWQLKELQYLKQTQDRDYVVGSQSTFWRAEGGQDYWGATALQRWGFVPPTPDSVGGFNPDRRQQARQIERTVSGAADPGTLVQLTKGLGGRVLAETIVDSSGVYRFDNVPATGQLSSQFYSGSYKVQLFENGQLANEPEIRSATFATLPGQLPAGASALIASAGMSHKMETEQMMGSFSQFRGGLAYRRGMSESLTVGAGFVQDETPQGLAEFFYLPKNIPLQAAVLARVDLQDGETRVNADVRYQPTKDLKFAFNSDRFSQRIRADWKIAPNVTLIAAGNTREKSLTAGARASYRLNRWSGNAIATIDTNRNLRWNLGATNGTFALSNYGNEISNYSNLSYRLPRRSKQGDAQLGHEIAIAHENHRASSSNNRSGQLTTAQWRYRSLGRTADGRSRWQYSLGYGIGSEGSGPVASVSAALGAGLDLQMRYQSVSAFSDSNNFQLSLVSRLDTQDGLGWGSRRQERLRTQGGLLVQPFLDNNGNGIREQGEPLYLESPELLLQVNHEAADRYRADVQDNGILMVLPPDTYRVDVDPAGLPVDRMTADAAYAVEVSAGQYTQLPLPLSIAHTVSGVVIGQDGLAVPGARVEAVSVSGHRQISITNGAGVYYLERLIPEAYNLIVDGTALESEPLNLENERESFHHREIHLL